MRILTINMSLPIQKLILTGLLVCGSIVSAYANNLTVSNVVLGSRDPGTKTLMVGFDVAWENSWRNKINHDAVWLTIRLNSTGSSPIYKKLCDISASGISPAGSSVGSNSALEFYVPADKKGLFLRRNTNSAIGNITTTGVSVTINYDSCGFSDTDQVNVSVLGLEMVLIPQGSFYAGDNDASFSSLDKGSADSRPWLIASESQITVNNAASNGNRYVSSNNPGEFSTGTSFNVPAAYPKGYNAFYAMKYEITEGQWVEFVNSLSSDAMRASHDLTDNHHKNSDSVVDRNTIACSGSPLICSSTRSQRAVTYLSWSDLTAFLDWAALRPLTELEFEKMARGPILPLNGEYAWGTTSITAAAIIDGNEDGSEVISNANANANYGHTVFSGGDANNGAENQQGALRGGIFATENSTRQSAGASYYGVLDLSGNVKEQTVTLGNSGGLAFTGVHGNGILTTASGFEGNADASNWPGMDADTTHGITGAFGSGLRGGSWTDTADALRVSDRTQAALTQTTADHDAGGRGVRTYDGN